MDKHDPLFPLLKGTTRRKVLLGAAAGIGGLAVAPWRALAADDSGLSQSAGAIHQEPVFPASPQRVYAALTDPLQFDKVMRLSQAMKSGAVAATPAEIHAEPGGAFSLFGGYVTGRMLELSPAKLIVQAWRSQSWKPSEYSIARYELVEQGAATKMIFDHRGFPDGTGEHLAQGWNINYWAPLREYLGGQK